MSGIMFAIDSSQPARQWHYTIALLLLYTIKLKHLRYKVAFLLSLRSQNVTLKITIVIFTSKASISLWKYPNISMVSYSPEWANPKSELCGRPSRGKIQIQVRDREMSADSSPQNTFWEVVLNFINPVCACSIITVANRLLNRFSLNEAQI